MKSLTMFTPFVFKEMKSLTMFAPFVFKEMKSLTMFTSFVFKEMKNMVTDGREGGWVLALHNYFLRRNLIALNPNLYLSLVSEKIFLLSFIFSYDFFREMF